MQLWIFYQSCDFYESFLQFNSKIQRKQSVQKAEQLMIAKYFSLIKGMLGMLWTIIIRSLRYNDPLSNTSMYSNEEKST